MNWLKRLFSGTNDKTDIKAVLSILALFIALAVYVAYAVKGLYVNWDMPGSIRDITVTLILGSVVGGGATLLNQRLGVSLMTPCPEPETIQTTIQTIIPAPSGLSSKI